MKTSSLLIPATFLAISPLSALDAPVLNEQFNGTGEAQFVNGAALGEAGSGVSGKPDDKAYVAADPNPDDKLQPAAILASSGLPQEMEQVTVTAWYKLSQPPRDAITLLDAGACYLLWQTAPDNGWNMRLEMPIQNKMRAWFNPRGSSAPVPWTAEGNWVFYAFTWERADGTAVVYQGDPQNEAREVKRFSNTGAVQLLSNGQRAAVIGNSYDYRTKKPGTRAFGGSIDNVRIFSTALSAEDIEKIRAADASNTPL